MIKYTTLCLGGGKNVATMKNKVATPVQGVRKLSDITTGFDFHPENCKRDMNCALFSAFQSAFSFTHLVTQ